MFRLIAIQPKITRANSELSGLDVKTPKKHKDEDNHLYGISQSRSDLSVKEKFYTQSVSPESPILDPYKYLGIIPGLQHSPKRSPVQVFSPSQNYPIIFADSGLGGLLFMLDSIREINSDLRRIELNTGLKFSAVHMGAANWAPFGNKPYDQIHSHTLSLIQESGRIGARIVTIACNTASITLDENAMKWVNTKFKDLTVIPIVKPTAKILYDESADYRNEFGIFEKHVAILATPATTRSQRYPSELALQHSFTNGNDALTIVVNPKFNLPLLTDGSEWITCYLGSIPVDMTSEQNQQIVESRLNGSSETQSPILYVYPYAPPNWVSILEGKSSGDFNTEVEQDIHNLFVQIGKSFNKLSVIGTCCTHYPAAIPKIEDLLKKSRLNETKVISQGAKIARDVILKMIEWEVTNSSSESESTPEKPTLKDKPTTLIPLSSYTSVDNVESKDSPLPGIERITTALFPDLTPHVKFQIMASLTDPDPPLTRKHD